MLPIALTAKTPVPGSSTSIASHVLALDLGGSHIACAVVGGAIVHAERTVATRALSLDAHLDEITAMLRDCLTQSAIDPHSLAGIAIGYCGIVDSRTGEILSTLDKYTDASADTLTRWARQHFNLPIRIENDARLALLGEAHAGAGRGAADIVMVTLGTGIGGAAMLDGRLIHSHAGQAGALGGHLPVNFRGRPCACGAIGCAEAEASTVVLPTLCREHPAFPRSPLAAEPTLDFATLFRALDRGDPVARDVLDHCLAVWSALTVGLIHAYGPKLVLFGGGVLHRAADILPPIRAYVARHMWQTTHGVPRIEPALLGHNAALIGAEALFFEAGPLAR